MWERRGAIASDPAHFLLSSWSHAWTCSYAHGIVPARRFQLFLSSACAGALWTRHIKLERAGERSQSDCGGWRPLLCCGQDMPCLSPTTKTGQTWVPAGRLANTGSIAIAARVVCCAWNWGGHMTKTQHVWLCTKLVLLLSPPFVFDTPLQHVSQQKARSIYPDLRASI